MAIGRGPLFSVYGASSKSNYTSVTERARGSRIYGLTDLDDTALMRDLFFMLQTVDLFSRLTDGVMPVEMVALMSAQGVVALMRNMAKLFRSRDELPPGLSTGSESITELVDGWESCRDREASPVLRVWLDSAVPFTSVYDSVQGVLIDRGILDWDGGAPF